MSLVVKVLAVANIVVFPVGSAGFVKANEQWDTLLGRVSSDTRRFFRNPRRAIKLDEYGYSEFDETSPWWEANQFSWNEEEE